MARELLNDRDELLEKQKKPAGAGLFAQGVN
jgi:hypothetical protein